MKIFDAKSLEGKTYLVTGGSSGIGMATARLLAECGARIIVSGQNQQRLQDCVAGLVGLGHKFSACTFENADQVFDWMKVLSEEEGPLNGVFHCAGIELIRPIRLTKQEHLMDVLGSSLFAAFGLARALSQKNVIVDGGSIVLMSSVAGSAGQVGLSAYSAAKASIDGLVRSFACELAPRKIRVNSLVAGAIKTAMHDRLIQGGNPDATIRYEQMHLLGFGEVDDIAQCAVYLLGPASRWITGTSLVVDGGYMVR